MDQKERFRKNIIKYQKREVGYRLFQLKDEMTSLVNSKLPSEGNGVKNLLKSLFLEKLYVVFHEIVDEFDIEKDYDYFYDNPPYYGDTASEVTDDAEE